MFFWTVIALRFVQTELARYFPGSIFSVESPDNYWVYSAIYAACVTAIGIELKIFNSVRIQIKLEEQERLLLHARMEALQNQINPHFLFNTLNSISSLVRFDPDMARDVIFKLATILRRLLMQARPSRPYARNLNSSTTTLTSKSSASAATSCAWSRNSILHRST